MVRGGGARGCYNGAMRFRNGLLIGLAVGYYFGARAGRERYEEIEAYLRQVRDTPTYRQVRERVLELVDAGTLQAREVLEDVLPGIDEEGPLTVVGDLPYDEDRWTGGRTDATGH